LYRVERWRRSDADLNFAIGFMPIRGAERLHNMQAAYTAFMPIKGM
jgi:hypothetical protein